MFGPSAGAPAFLPVLLVALVACYSAVDDGAGSGAGDPNSSTAAAANASECVATRAFTAAELAAPIVDFEKDVAPILVTACASSTCHGSISKNHGVFLAPKSADAMKKSLQAKSKKLPEMPYVTPGDPENSFLMHKLDADLCTIAERCVGRSCGKTMPADNDLLTEAERDTVRRWIAQGAQ